MSALPFPTPANDREYQINVLHQTRRQVEPKVNPAAHDHDDPAYVMPELDAEAQADIDLARKVAELAPVPAVRVPIESFTFRTDMITLFRVDEDELRYSQLPGFEYACEAAWERLERNLPDGQYHAISRAANHGWMTFSNAELDRARRYFSERAIFDVI